MPLNKKGKKIMKSMKEQYGSKKGQSVFYATMNKGKLKGVEKKKYGGAVKKGALPPEKGPNSQGMKEGGSVTVKTKLGRNRPTKIC